MPVVPCFDPTTGASGGAPPAASASLWNLTTTAIDLTDGSWTLYDPDSLIDTVSHAAGLNTVTWNALAAGSADYNWSAGTTHRAPRWSKLLQIDGNQVTQLNTLLFTTRVEVDTTVNDFDQQLVVGVALDPSSTTATTIDGTGAKFDKTTGGGPGYGTWQVNSGTTSTNNNNEYSVCTVLRSSNSLGAGAYVNIDSSDVAVTSNSRNSNQNAAGVGTVNVHILVGVGPRLSTGTITAGDQQAFKASFTAATIGVS